MPRKKTDPAPGHRGQVQGRPGKVIAITGTAQFRPFAKSDFIDTWDVSHVKWAGRLLYRIVPHNGSGEKWLDETLIVKWERHPDD